MISGATKIIGIVLAAGLSTRMGKVKPLLPWGDSMLLDKVIENASGSKLDGLRVVLGHEAETISGRIDFRDAEVIVNDDYQSGLSSSLRAGLRALPDDAGGAMFLLGDQPFVAHETIDLLITAFHRHCCALLIPTYRGTRGNPVVLHSSIFKMVERISGDVGARVLFDGLQDRIEEIEVADRGILIDIDTVEHYRRYVRRLGGS